MCLCTRYLQEGLMTWITGVLCYVFICVFWVMLFLSHRHKSLQAPFTSPCLRSGKDALQKYKPCDINCDIGGLVVGLPVLIGYHRAFTGLLLCPFCWFVLHTTLYETVWRCWLLFFMRQSLAQAYRKTIWHFSRAKNCWFFPEGACKMTFSDVLITASFGTFGMVF